MKICSPQSVIVHIKKVILLGFFLGLRDIVNLSTTFFIQRFFFVFYFFHKNALFKDFILGVNVFYIYGMLHHAWANGAHPLSPANEWSWSCPRHIKARASDFSPTTSRMV